MPPVATSRTTAIAAGSNLGDAATNIRHAFAALSQSPLISDARLSPLYRTAPVRVSADGPDPGGDYINAAILARTSATPQQLLDLLHQIEREGGRDRAHNPHGAPRPIDLDLLLVEGVTISTPELTLPHPRMHLRAFVLVPLAEIAPDLQITGWGVTVARLLAQLGPLDARAVRRIDP